jgi:dGTP triphosphohydrolase
MEYKFIDPTKTLGKASREYLRNVSGYKRLPSSAIQEIIFANNMQYEEQQKQKEERKKQTKSAVAELPQYIEQNEQVQKQIKAERKREQKQQAIKQFEDRLAKNILQNVGGRYNLKLNSFLRKFSNNKNAIKQMLRSIDKVLLSNGKKINVKINNLNYVLNANTIEKLFALLSSQLVEGINVSGSDEAFVNELENAESIEIYEFVKTNKYEKANGAFFKYNHVLDFDFRLLQIFNSTDPVDYDNCLTYALLQGGLSDEKLEKLRLMCKTDNIPVCKLKDICEQLQIRINLKKTKKGDYGFFNYGEQYTETYTLGLLDEHYFLLTELNITSYAIKNYHEIKHINEWNRIAKKGDKRNDRFIDSFTAVRLLLEHKEELLTPLTKIDILNSPYYKKVDNEIINLNYEAKKDINFRPIEPKTPKEQTIVNIFYDFETYTDANGKHIPYLCCYRIKGVCHTKYGESSGLEMLFHLSNVYKYSKSIVRLIAHNGGKYDSHFIFRYLIGASGIKKGSRFMTIKGKFNEVNFELRDSLLLISMPLKSFSKTFKLGDTVKEVISYNMYNKTDCIQRKLIPISEGLEWVKNDRLDEEQFLNNIEKWNLKQGEYFDCIEYSRFYCQIDCEILEKGYNTFNKWMQELVNTNIDNVLTLASLAHNFFINEKCYEGVNELAGTPQQFIQKCVVGGRVMCSENKKNIEDKGKKIMDFDAVSLYPSAMKRMDGYLKGLPKVVDNLDFNSIRNYDGYFLQIVVKSVGINRKFPTMSFVNEEGIRTFTNDMIGKTMFIDKIALEDSINQHNIEFDVIRGYYFNEGFNTKINETIQHIFNERKKLKAQKNPAEVVYKLIMNSAYGKSILKEVETEIQFFNNVDDMNVFISRNYNWVQNYEAIDNSTMWILEKVNPINNHFNIAQVGVSILSWSKRIMNEVMGLAEDNSLEMFYQDTDSIHISADHIEILAKLFHGVYGRELIGEDLGQFHSDFDLKGCEEVYANRSIFLGKKCYIDELKGIDENGQEQTDYHIRMKGVPNSTIKHTAKNLGITVFELYEKLYDGEAIKFDLTENGAKENFKINKNGTINTLPFFERIISF